MDIKRAVPLGKLLLIQRGDLYIPRMDILEEAGVHPAQNPGSKSSDREQQRNKVHGSDPASQPGDVIPMCRLQWVGKERHTFYMGGKRRKIFSAQVKLEKPRLGRPWRRRQHPWLSISLGMETFLH